MLSHKMDFNCCANRDGFRIDSHNYVFNLFCFVCNFVFFVVVAVCCVYVCVGEHV